MDKYNPLYTYLCGNNEDQIILDFSEIEEIIGDKLPKSALNYAAWWSNSTKGG